MGVDHGSPQGLPSGYPTGSQGDLQQEMASFLSIARSQGRRSRQIQELDHREKILLTAMETIETIGHWAKSGGCQMIHANCWRKCGKKNYMENYSRSSSASPADQGWNFSLSSNFGIHFSCTPCSIPWIGKRMENAYIIRPWCFRLPF